MNLEHILSLFKENPIDYISLILAIIAGLLSWRSNIISKKAYKIAKQEFESKQSDFDLYLVSSYRWTTKLEEIKRVILVSITIHNKSQSNSSYKATLRINYIDESDKIRSVYSDYNIDLFKEVSYGELKPFDTDINIEGKHSSTKWLAFEEPYELVMKYRVKRYEVIITDINQQEHKIDIYLVKDIANEN